MKFQWRVRLAEHSPQKRAVLWACVMGTVAMGIGLRIPVLGFLGAGLLAPILFEYHRGRSFVVSDEGVVAGFNNLNWTSIRSVRVLENAVQLSPFEAESRLDATRGVTLIFDEAVDRTGVMDFIRKHLNDNVRFWSEELDEEQTEELLAKAAEEIRRRKLEAPAILFFEMHKPISNVMAHLTVATAPMLVPFLGYDFVNQYSNLLRKRDNVERLICMLEEMPVVKTELLENQCQKKV